MGIAKQRGTFEQRKEQAVENKRLLVEAQNDNIARLAEIETQSDDYRTKVVASVAQMQLKEYDNRRDAVFQALWRVDHTLTGVTI